MCTLVGLSREEMEVIMSATFQVSVSTARGAPLAKAGVMAGLRIRAQRTAGR
jgi:hypothetical protein